MESYRRITSDRGGGLGQPKSEVVRVQDKNADGIWRVGSEFNTKTLFYVVDWLPPDFGAVGQYGTIFARELAKNGRNVCLIGLTAGVSENRSERYSGGGVLEVRKLSAKRYNKSGIVSRSLWSLRTNVRLMWEVVKDRRARRSEILFTGSPPFMLFVAIFVKLLRQTRLIYRITDFYPEVLIAALGKRPVLLAIFERITWFLRRRVDQFEVLGEDQRRILLAGGIAPSKIMLKRDISPTPVSGSELPMPRPPELAASKVLLYSGNYGVAHEVDTVVQGLIRHHSEGSGQFGLWLNGSGSSIEAVLAPLRAAGIPVASGHPVPLEELPALLAAADAHLITLRPGFSGLVLPSKLYACLDSRRPIVFIGPESSDVNLLCSRVERAVYEHIEPGDTAGFAAALERLAQHTSSIRPPFQESKPASCG
jgi:hypothetical protein